MIVFQVVMIRIHLPLPIGRDVRTKVNHNVVIHHSFFDPFAIFALCKPSIVGSKPISVAQKLHSPLLRANEEVDSALRYAFRESKHHPFRIISACPIKFVLELRFWDGPRRDATAFEIFPWFQILRAEMFEDSDYECGDIGVSDETFRSQARAILHIVHVM